MQSSHRIARVGIAVPSSPNRGMAYSACRHFTSLVQNISYTFTDEVALSSRRPLPNVHTFGALVHHSKLHGMSDFRAKRLLRWDLQSAFRLASMHFDSCNVSTSLSQDATATPPDQPRERPPKPDPATIYCYINSQPMNLLYTRYHLRPKQRFHHCCHQLSRSWHPSLFMPSR